MNNQQNPAEEKSKLDWTTCRICNLSYRTNSTHECTRCSVTESEQVSTEELIKVSKLLYEDGLTGPSMRYHLRLVQDRLQSLSTLLDDVEDKLNEALEIKNGHKPISHIFISIDEALTKIKQRNGGK